MKRKMSKGFRDVKIHISLPEELVARLTAQIEIIERALTNVRGILVGVVRMTREEVASRLGIPAERLQIVDERG